MDAFRISEDELSIEEHRKILNFVPHVANPFLESERVQFENATRPIGAKNLTGSVTYYQRDRIYRERILKHFLPK